MTSLFVFSALAITGLMIGVWLLSVLKRNASIVDIFWGIGFAMVAFLGRCLGEGAPTRANLITVLTMVWGLRLATHLAWRNWGQPEDYRYQAMRRSIGERFWIVSLFTVFGLQGTLMWLISTPVQFALQSAEPTQLTIFDGLGALLWIAGFAFEGAGDLQLARFKADPGNRGKVMDRGLWRYTRHPNYFGDALLWWGLFLIGFSTPGSGWTVLSPIVMTGLLMRVSGVPLLEGRLVKTRPQYADYIRRTSSFVPWWPKD